MSAPSSVKRSKSHLAIALFLIGAILIGGPYGLAHYKLMPVVKPYGWLVLGVAYAGALIKAGLSFLMTRDFRYDKTAYEISALVFGGSLTCLALQILTASILFPGLQSVSFLGFASKIDLGIRGQDITLLLLLLLGSLVSTIFSAIGVADADSGNPKWFWTLGCSFLAYLLLGMYALALIAKG